MTMRKPVQTPAWLGTKGAPNLPGLRGAGYE